MPFPIRYHTFGLGDRSLLFGFGVVKLIFGGIVMCSSDSTALMMLVIPEAPSPCPKFGFTDPTYVLSPPKTFPTAATSKGSPTEVPVPWHSKNGVCEKSSMPAS